MRVWKKLDAVQFLMPKTLEDMPVGVTARMGKSLEFVYHGSNPPMALYDGDWIVDGEVYSRKEFNDTFTKAI